MAPDAEREKEVNWRLSKSASAGIIGEVGIHQIDLANWYLASLPTAVTGFGSIIYWNDGRDIPDTVQCIIEYPNDVRMNLNSTIVSSFSSNYTLFQGCDASLALRENRGWMIKEADSPLLGWEVYARKETCFDEANAICMVADATKIIKDGKEPGQMDKLPPTKEPIYIALENFTKSIRDGSKPACGAVEGYQASVVAIKANDAVVGNTKITYQKEAFDL
jgi:predicted dehydrogenase